MTLTFGVVLLHHNEPEDIGPCLDALVTHQRRFDQLVLVDNASSPDNAAAAKELVESHGGLFLPAPGNDGFASGNNLGIAALHGGGVDVAVIVNPDATLAPGCLDRVLDHLAANADVAAANPLIVNDSGRVWSAGGYFSRWQGRLIQREFGKTPTGIRTANVSFVTGCVLALRISALADVGLLNDELFIYYEDVELSERLLAAGWKLSLVAEARAEHRRGAFGDPDRHLGPFMLHHTMSSRGALVRGRLSGLQRLAALAFTPAMVGRFAYLIARSGSTVKRAQLSALLAGTIEGLRRRPLDESRIPRLD